MKYKNHKQYRLPAYDYSSAGDYFITVCTNNRRHHFGKITRTKEDAFIELSPIGVFVSNSIVSIPETYKDVILGESVVMPNHIHLIITLPLKEKIAASSQSSLQQIMAPYKGLTALMPGSVSSIINHLKGKVKKWCNANGYSDFQWQARFHDHIIRDAEAFNRISNYIANNIWNWNDDENNEGGGNFRKDILP